LGDIREFENQTKEKILHSKQNKSSLETNRNINEMQFESLAPGVTPNIVSQRGIADAMAIKGRYNALSQLTGKVC
jgi:hypothetical protein